MSDRGCVNARLIESTDQEMPLPMSTPVSRPRTTALPAHLDREARLQSCQCRPDTQVQALAECQVRPPRRRIEIDRAADGRERGEQTQCQMSPLSLMRGPLASHSAFSKREKPEQLSLYKKGINSAN